MKEPAAGAILPFFDEKNWVTSMPVESVFSHIKKSFLKQFQNFELDISPFIAKNFLILKFPFYFGKYF